MSSEQHPYFPSGVWEGHYNYVAGPDAHRHPMSFYLDFRDGNVTGSGSDDIGAFTWAGTYDTATMAVRLRKTYRTHQVLYDGRADESGIYGGWRLPGLHGGFHIWPRKGGEDEVAEEAVVTEERIAVPSGSYPRLSGSRRYAAKHYLAP